jgi:hypothetical protein
VLLVAGKNLFSPAHRDEHMLTLWQSHSDDVRSRVADSQRLGRRAGTLDLPDACTTPTLYREVVGLA